MYNANIDGLSDTSQDFAVQFYIVNCEFETVWTDAEFVTTPTWFDTFTENPSTFQVSFRGFSMKTGSNAACG